MTKPWSGVLGGFLLCLAPARTFAADKAAVVFPILPLGTRFEVPRAHFFHLPPPRLCEVGVSKKVRCPRTPLIYVCGNFFKETPREYTGLCTLESISERAAECKRGEWKRIREITGDVRELTKYQARSRGIEYSVAHGKAQKGTANTRCML